MYIGNSSILQQFAPAIDYFSGTGSATQFTLSRTVGSTIQVQVVIENVVQNPSSAYTIVGQTITFSSAPPSGTNNIYVTYIAPTTQVTTLPQSPSISGSVTASGGYYAIGGFTGIYTDGSVLDYATGLGRLSVGPADAFAFYNGGPAGTETMRIDASGNLGIGTASPSDKLSISSNSCSVILGTGYGTFSGTNYYYGKLQLADSIGRTLIVTSPSNLVNGQIGTTSNHQLDFLINNSVRASIDVNGRLGIGGAPAVSIDASSKTDAIGVPAGTTAQRPSSLAAGQTRYNSTIAQAEYYNGSAWNQFTTIPSSSYSALYTLVGGGAGGGVGTTDSPGGGGGAGGVNQGTLTLTTGVTYTMYVGGGGAGGTVGTSYPGNGNTSYISGTGIVTQYGQGGGSGGNSLNNGDVPNPRPGGSGGGCGALKTGSTTLTNNIMSSIAGAGGATGQGNTGCAAMYYASSFISGGSGGGAGTSARVANTGNGPVGGASAGGDGILSIIDGNYYGGGGGGGYGSWQTSNMSNGGAGGGGQGGCYAIYPTNGSTNFGGGGGGAGCNSGYFNGATGGSGVIIISIPTARYTGTTTGSPTVTTSGSNTILKFTSTGSYTA
jgi:hypothetical protein